MTDHRRQLSAAVTAALAIALVAGPGLAVAQEAARAESLPEARSILDQYVKAMGGKKALQKAQSIKMTGELQIPAAGISGKLMILTMAPNKLLLTAEIPGMGEIREGFDGEVAWSIDPNMGPRIKQGGELAQTEFQSDFYAALHADDRYESMETVEKTEIDGKTCYKLRLVTRAGDEMFEYFDVDSGLMVANEMTAKTPMGDVKVLGAMGEYREVEKLKVPTRLSMKMGPMEQVMVFSDVSLGSVDPSVFELPAEIQALTEE